MKLIIAGSRTFTNLNINDFILTTINELSPHSPSKETSPMASLMEITGKPVEIVSGGAKGIDALAKGWANFVQDWRIGRKISYKEFPADWDKHGKAAGPIRNKQMADYADALLLIWDGKSKGSANMKDNMLKLNKPVYEVILKTHNC